MVIVSKREMISPISTLGINFSTSLSEASEGFSDMIDHVNKPISSKLGKAAEGGYEKTEAVLRNTLNNMNCMNINLLTRTSDDDSSVDSLRSNDSGKNDFLCQFLNIEIGVNNAPKRLLESDRNYTDYSSYYESGTSNDYTCGTKVMTSHEWPDWNSKNSPKGNSLMSASTFNNNVENQGDFKNIKVEDNSCMNPMAAQCNSISIIMPKNGISIPLDIVTETIKPLAQCNSVAKNIKPLDPCNSVPENIKALSPCGIIPDIIPENIKPLAQCENTRIPLDIVTETVKISDDKLIQKSNEKKQKSLTLQEGTLMCAKICLVVASFPATEKFSTLPEPDKMDEDSDNDLDADLGVNTLIRYSIIDCSRTKDLLLEAFFTCKAAVEICVFRSSILRQIFVCFKGSAELQDKPVKWQIIKLKKLSAFKSKEPLYSNDVKDDFDLQVKPEKKQRIKMKKFSFKSKEPSYLNDVYDDFLDSYISIRERMIFSYIDRLMENFPSFELVMTGHSFGATLATIASVRYASAKPLINVVCNVFGSPRVGGAKFCNHAISLSNLKLNQVVQPLDPYVSIPNGPKWKPVGRIINVRVDDVDDLEKDRYPCPNDLHYYIKALETCELISSW